MELRLAPELKICPFSGLVHTAVPPKTICGHRHWLMILYLWKAGQELWTGTGPPWPETFVRGSQTMFNNRTDAGRQLAERLEVYLSNYRGRNWQKDLLVIGLPRGGVPVALELARRFNCPLEIIVAKKLPYPGQPEYAIGAVSSDGLVVLNPDIPDNRDWAAYIDQQRRILLEKNVKMEQSYYELSGLTKNTVDGKTVIIVDDGVATGMTALAAVETARARGAKQTIMAAPVMSLDSYQKLRQHCDDVLALRVEREFRSVSEFYRSFEQTSNEEVVTALRASSNSSRRTA